MVMAAVAGAAVGALGSRAKGKAAGHAANAQVAAADAGIAEQRRQFDSIQQLLSPFVTGGTQAFGGRLDLAGVRGNDAQAAAIAALQNSPGFTSLLQQGENSILANAAATGGLRGGNTQAALAQFSPQLLAGTINDQFSRLGGLATMGQNAAAQVGSFGQASSNNITELLQQQGAARAGHELAKGGAKAGMWNSVGSAIGFGGGLSGGGLSGGGFNLPQWGGLGGTSVAGGGLLGQNIGQNVFNPVRWGTF